MDPRAERAARNEALFREVNERIGEAAQRWDDDRIRALCECHFGACADFVDVSREEYEAVRAHGDRFLLVDGHQDEEVEQVVERTDRFVVVEKIGEGAEVAQRLDPRS